MSDNTIFLELDTVAGSLVHKEYMKQIAISSYSYSSANGTVWPVVTSGRRTSGKPVSGEFSFSKPSDLSTAVLHRICLMGENIKKGTLTISVTVSGKVQKLFTYEFTNILITNISTSSSGGVPTDSFSLNYTKISVIYGEQGSTVADAGKTAYVHDAAAMLTKTT